MQVPHVRHLSVLLALGFLAPAVLAADKQPLDHEVYTEWNVIDEQTISRDGEWVLWSMSPEENDGVLGIAATDGETEYEIERGGDGEFSYDSRHAVFLVEPEFAEARQAERDDKEAHERPQSALGIVDLASGEREIIERVSSFAMPEKAGGWVAWRHAPPEETDAERNGEGIEDDEGNEAEREDGQEPGQELVLRNLDSGEERRFQDVRDYAFAENGELLAFTVVSEDGEGDGVFALEPGAEGVAPVMTGKGEYPQLAVDHSGGQVAFLSRPAADNDDGENDNGRPEHAFDLHVWETGTTEARHLADENSEALPGNGWHVSRHGELNFSGNDGRLFFGSAPEPFPEPDHGDKTEEEIVDVQIWHHDDDRLQPMQEVQKENDRERSYKAVAHLNDGDRLVQLGRESIPEVALDEDREAEVVLGVSNLPYQKEISWDFPRYYDAYLIDVHDGSVERILEAVQDWPELSPEAGFVHWWDRDEASWYAMDVDAREAIDLGAAIPEDLDDHTNDRPYPSNPYGAAGWLAGDAGLLVYDRFDIWLTDPADPDNPVLLTEGYGREAERNLRHADTTPDEPAIDPEADFLLSGFDENSKADGFYRGSADTAAAPEQLVHSDHAYGTPERAEDGDQLLYTREDFDEFPDLRVSGPDFAESTRLTEANPQQSDYRWGQVELVEWTSRADEELEGLLFKPEDFDPDEEYPMVVYFYERHSDGLHQHRPPQAHRSVIIPTFYTSNDYVVFVPDIHYRIPEPGESAMDAIMPKTRDLAGEDWIDADRVGIQGHSWAGYQIAYMVTQTDFFRTAAGGAPVSNMVSAYGGIRWRTGMSRMFQYERTQSRLGVTLWEDRDPYLDNSPIFKADQIHTPLLMMHNDQDGAVPWEQGIELFTALRRLDREAWLINYEGEPHWPTTFANRVDWQKRLQQYLDYYLKDEPPARWIEEGIPAVERGTTKGYEPVSD